MVWPMYPTCLHVDPQEQSPPAKRRKAEVEGQEKDEESQMPEQTGEEETGSCGKATPSNILEACSHPVPTLAQACASDFVLQ